MTVMRLRCGDAAGGRAVSRTARAADARGVVAAAGTDSPALRAAARWLRRSYRIGAIVDGLAAVGMVFPGPLWTANFRAPFDRNRVELTYGMRTGAPLMGGWGLLLLWADRNPTQRKGVLPLTCAVVLGLMANDTAAARSGHVPSETLLPTRLLQGALLGLFAASYVRALAAERSTAQVRSPVAANRRLSTRARVRSTLE